MRSMMGFSSFGTQRPAGTYLLPASRHSQCVRTERGRAVFMQNAFSFSLTSCVWDAVTWISYNLSPVLAENSTLPGSCWIPVDGLEFEGEVFSVVEVDEKLYRAGPTTSHAVPSTGSNAAPVLKKAKTGAGECCR